jgi:hypothetical protein
MPNKLTAPQQRVINALIENEGSYLLRSNLYHWNSVICDKKIIIDCIHRPTFYSLKYKKLVVEFEKDKCKLNPDFKQVIKN